MKIKLHRSSLPNLLAIMIHRLNGHGAPYAASGDSCAAASSSSTHATRLTIVRRFAASRSITLNVSRATRVFTSSRSRSLF